MAHRPSLILSLHGTTDIEADRLFGTLNTLTDIVQTNGGIPVLIDMLRRNRLEPDIIFIELDGEPNRIFEELDTLKDHVSSATSVFGFGRINDARFLRSLLAIGLKDYFVLPLEDQTLEDISRIITVRDTKSLQPIIGFVSLAGGVGTSLVALNFAQFLAERSVSGVVLAHPHLPPYNTQFDHYDFNASSTTSTAQPILIKPHRVQADEQNDGLDSDTLGHAIEAYRAEDKVVLIDLGTRLSDHTGLALCDHILAIGEPDYRSLLNLKPLISYLSSHFPFAERHLALTKIGRDGRIEFGDQDVHRLINEQPVMLYQYDLEAVAVALTKPVPLLPQSLLKDQHAFEKLCARCRIELKPRADTGQNRSGLFSILRAFLAKWQIANG